MVLKDQSTMRDQVAAASLTAPLTRAGMNSMRVCVFHLSSQRGEWAGQPSSRSPGKHVHRLPGSIRWTSLGATPTWPSNRCTNSLLLLIQYEDALGQPYRGPQIDWNTFPGLDPMIATVLEWGHSMTDDQWSELPADTKEFKLSVSE